MQKRDERWSKQMWHIACYQWLLLKRKDEREQMLQPFAPISHDILSAAFCLSLKTRLKCKQSLSQSYISKYYQTTDEKHKSSNKDAFEKENI